MIKSKYWYWILISVFLITQVVLGKDEKFDRLAVSYVTGIDETFYPFIPQLFLMMGRQKVITNFFNSFENIIQKLPGTANLWMFENIKEEVNQLRDWMEAKTLNLGDKYNIGLIGENRFESFQDFQKDLVEYYTEFGLEKAFKIHNEIEIIGKKIMNYQFRNDTKILDEVENRWNHLLNGLDLSKNNGNKTSYELRRKINQTIMNHFVIVDTPKKMEFNMDSYNSDFSNKFWDGHLNNYKLVTLFHEYSIQQLNMIYKQKLIWLRIHLTIKIIDLDGFLNKVYKLASNTMVHSISLTSLQYLYQIKDRIDFFLLNESYLDQLLEIYDNLSIAINRWMRETLILDDLQYLYTHLMIEGLDIRTLATNLFDRIKHYGEIELIVDKNIYRKRSKVARKKSGFLSYFSTGYDISKKLENNMSSLKDKHEAEEVEKLKEIEKIVKEESKDSQVFKHMIELRVNSELEEEVLKNYNLYEDHIEFYLSLDRVESRYRKFVRQSTVFLSELESTSMDCQTLYFSASQAGNMIYEIVANEILKTSNRSGKVNMNSSKNMKSLIKDLESVKESIDTIKETEEDSDATDILGESISDEDFIYVPGTVGNFKKSQSTSGYLIIRISVIVGLLVLAIILYIYKEKILVKKVNSEENKIYERYCSRVSLDEVEFNSSLSSENKKKMKRNKYYKVDSKSGNIILKQQK
ncbi:uncharacterized protein cubi_00870 [Cryptosporidium ubiquitum]|uniref:Uncharacterized protein n=1 Tax=Cryptosporidium ubiquitum TaxID=857276 RepID=A0A1J4MF62_9CRYT|nr:uncharacterized protein cubi_00870 [Cryptosporidium ubiquitum]OII72898.1 hypothetical protein cubi_00870 [Cryptosporidium ubiquitum]